jgi:class 3 adenylate cyclase/predicted ATPase
MQCSRCRADNRSGRRFCAVCGAPLAAACGTPRFANEAEERFCGGCGRPLLPEPLSPTARAPDTYTPSHLVEKILTTRGALEGERKQVTVLFADLKGSMELLANRDPEEARKILDPVLERMMEAVHRYEGTVNQVMGDGVMALFGAPLAHEDHALRACYAALRMQESIRRYSDETRRRSGTPVSIRVGLNSGEVVVRSIGSDLRMDYSAVGQTTHLAARMEQAALPGSIVITPATHLLVQGYVDVRSLGPMPVKGLNGAIEIFEITGAGAVRRRLQALAARALSRFVGRDDELERLTGALKQAAQGRGQLVAVVGEPGVGKSRLFFEFTREHRAGWLVLESGSVSYGRTTSYLAVVDLLKSYFKIGDRDDQRHVREKITGKLMTLDRALEPSLSALLTLFEVGVDDPEWHASDPRERRQRTLDAVKRLLLAESRIQPLLLVFEDLHWVDAESQLFLNVLVDSLPTARILLLVNYRHEYQDTWGHKTYYMRFRIDPLPEESASELLEALLGPDPGLDPLRRLLIARTEGNPFILEESVRALVETGALTGERGAYRPARAVDAPQIPATAQAIIAARIDRLSPEHKRLLQAASVIGKDVPFALLHAIISGQDEGALSSGLRELQATEFLYETRLFPDVEYTFKHALTHEVTYGSLLQDRRRVLHASIVDAIERLNAGRLGEYVELLAHHAVRGEAWEKAARYLREAGTKAFLRSATADAVGYLTKGLEVLERLPVSPGRDREELASLLTLGPALHALKGLGAPEAEHVFVRARNLSERTGETVPAFQALWGQWMVSAGLRRIVPARRIGSELLTLAERADDRALLLHAHHAMWATSFWLGELGAAEHHIACGTNLYDPDQHRSLAFLYGGHDAGVCCRQFSIWTQWMLGRPAKAAAEGQAALVLAEQLAHPPSLAQAFTWSCALSYFERDSRAAGQTARRLIDLSMERELPAWRVAGTIFEGWCQAEAGDWTTGIAQIREGLAAAKTTGTLMPLEPLYLMVHADACLKHNLLEDGLHAVHDALAMMEEGGQRTWQSNLYRLRGELLLLQGHASHEEAERSFRRALEIARQQRAQAWELRAATSLGRLLGQQGRRDEARETLGHIFGRFTEGFETANLTEASALLAQLS